MTIHIKRWYVDYMCRANTLNYVATRNYAFLVLLYDVRTEYYVCMCCTEKIEIEVESILFVGFVPRH